MAWIIGAAILNTLWTLWCAQLLPARIAIRFGLNGEPDGFASRKGFALFSILFPLATSAFLVYIGGVVHFAGGVADAMEHLAAGFIIFFSLLSWSIVRSNRRSPARMDYPSLLASVAVLLVFVLLLLGGIFKASR